MSNNNTSVFDLFLALPWWVNLLLAPLVYGGMVKAPDWVTVSPNSPGYFLVGALPTAAPIFAGLFVLLALVSFVRRLERRKLLNHAKSIDHIRALGWREFEMLVGEAYRRQGYKVEETQTGPDGGIDLRLRKDGELTLVQCKHWRTQRVGVKPVRELYGVMVDAGAHAGIFVASGTYTPDAHAFAEGKRLELVDGRMLEALIRDVSTPLERPPTTPPAPTAPKPAPVGESTPRQPAAAPTCPTCGKPMVRRTARRGAQAGKAFWGCSGFPKCRTTMPIDS
jgi:restriction system protein